MNCIQARALLAISRELKQGSAEQAELEAHLAHCEECRKAQTRYQQMGVTLRSLPQLEPAPDAYSKLMHALAAEQVRFMQRAPVSAEATPAPAFLAPYLKDLAQKRPRTDTIVALSAAETGPLPLLQPMKRPPLYRSNHLAIIGIAASFLILLMAGGLTSLLLLGHGSGGGTGSASITFPLVRAHSYETTALYPNVASAAANGKTIYYTAYGPESSVDQPSTDNQSTTSSQAAVTPPAVTTDWMLEAFDNRTGASTPLLSTPTHDKLIVLGSSKDWLIWLQLGTQRVQTQGAKQKSEYTWSLHAHALGTDAATITATEPSYHLLQGTFKQDAVPSWVNKPVQGIWLSQDTLLVAMIDDKGISHLLSYQLDTAKPAQESELAHAPRGHILTSPTANSDGSAIYWSEEWAANPLTNDLSSNIWTRQVIDAPVSNLGRWIAHKEIDTYQFSSDGKAFHPQIVSDTLFVLNKYMTAPVSTPTPTSTAVTATATAAVTPTATAQATPEVQPTPTPDVTPWLGGATRIDPTISLPQPDETITGTLSTFTTSGVVVTLDNLDTKRLVSDIQSGNGFLIWQNSAKAFEMYDVTNEVSIKMDANTVPRAATFLQLNGNTAVSIINPSSSVGQTGADNQKITFYTFKWP